MQRVLQYPVCLIVVEPSSALLVGPSTGLSTRELTGSGWALGTMLQPAAGAMLLGGPVSDLTDRAIRLDAVPGLDGSALTTRVRQLLDGDPEVHRVGQVCTRFDLSERSLQRLTARRTGLTPKWLIQRRRLHEAAERLASPDPPDLAQVAADLGYADQAHFTRDFRTVTGLTPGEYAAEMHAPR